MWDYEGFRPCGRVPHRVCDGGDEYIDIRAYVEDGSGYYAALVCAEDFGCVGWESRDE